MKYPPFLSLINIVISHHKKNITEQAANFLGQTLKKRNNKLFIMLGPLPCPIFKISNQFRYQFIIKLIKRNESKSIIKDSLNLLAQNFPAVNFYCDVDPISIM